MPREFPTATAAKVTGASVRMLDNWARTYLLPPSGREAAGKGTRRSYTFQDLVSIRTIVDLRAKKCPLQQIRIAVMELRKLYPELSNSQTLSRLTLLTDGKRVYILNDEVQAMDVLTRQTVWGVPLGRHIIETTQRVEKLPQKWVEDLTVAGERFHVDVMANGKDTGFSAHCRELPGALERGVTADEAVQKVQTSIAAVQLHLARENRTGASVRRRAVN